MASPSFWNFLKQSLCAVIPKPSDAVALSTQSQQLRVRQIQKMTAVLPKSLNAPVFSSIKGVSAKDQQIRIQQFYKDLRSFLSCGDTFNVCETDADCGTNTQTCYQNKCIPAISHCLVSGCSNEKKCNTQTGACEEVIQPCTSDLDCDNGKICTDNQCEYPVGKCQTDLQCIDYVDSGGAKNKCSPITKSCVECLPYQPSICGKQGFGKEALPACDELNNQCFLGCDYSRVSNTFEQAGTSECCKVERINPSLPFNAGKQRKSDCCEQKFRDTGSWNGLTWNSGAETCYVKPYTPSDRNCTLPFGGKTPNKTSDPDNQCSVGYTCDWEVSSSSFGQCVF